jgi:pyruvate dehydrogenase E1 component beta subunit
MSDSSGLKAARSLTMVQAINEAMHIAMESDPRVICFGLGVDDPRRIFNTTANLIEKFGPERVFDMPTSENAMTGIGIGASFTGIRPVMVHQRLDFFLLAMDQLVNTAAKWHYMFGGQQTVPITIRLMIGHGWGQGPTHSQNLQAWFAHIPGLKVVMPTTPADAKGLLLASIFDDNPVVFLEHRWCHNMEGSVPEGDVREELGKARKVREGADITIVALSYMVVEALHAADFLSSEGISVEIIDLRSLQPLDWPAVLESVRKTGRLLALDTAQETCSVSSEVVARVSMELHAELKCAPRRLGQPDFPSPTSFALTKSYYRGAEAIVDEIRAMLGKSAEGAAQFVEKSHPHDVPGDWFKGPF